MNNMNQQRRNGVRWVRLLEIFALGILIVVGTFFVIGKGQERRAELSPIRAEQTREHERALRNLELVKGGQVTGIITETVTPP